MLVTPEKKTLSNFWGHSWDFSDFDVFVRKISFCVWNLYITKAVYFSQFLMVKYLGLLAGEYFQKLIEFLGKLGIVG